MQAGLFKTHFVMISVLTRILDVLLVAAAGGLLYLLRFDSSYYPFPDAYGALILIGGLLCALVFPALGVYRSWRARGLFAPAASAVAAWSVVFLALMVLVVVAKQGNSFSRLWLAEWATTVAFLLVGLRVGVYAGLRSMRRRGYNQRNAVVVGCGPGARELVRQTHEATWAGFDVIAVFAGAEEKGEAVEGVVPRSLAELPDFLQDHSVDEVWIAMPLDKGELMREILESLRNSAVNVRYVPDLFGLFLLNHGMTEILGMPMIDLSASPMQGVNRLVKGLEDRLLAALILLLISPLMLLIAIGVKLSSTGPVFFRQERLGWSGRPFEMLKFRSMSVDVEKNGVQWGNAKNKQVTSFGAFLRRTSLDELPQFINVLKGDMSIVGPRPERPVFVDRFKTEIPGYMQKHMVKAGITGWAQVNGWRGDTDLHKRIEHDLYYIENWSLLFDLKIIFLTLFKGFVHKNAH